MIILVDKRIAAIGHVEHCLCGRDGNIHYLTVSCRGGERGEGTGGGRRDGGEGTGERGRGGEDGGGEGTGERGRGRGDGGEGTGRGDGGGGEGLYRITK